jgi:hypothetical protein
MVAILAGPSISACAPHRRSDLWRRAGAMGLGGGVPQHFWSPKEGGKVPVPWGLGAHVGVDICGRLQPLSMKVYCYSKHCRPHPVPTQAEVSQSCEDLCDRLEFDTLKCKVFLLADGSHQPAQAQARQYHGTGQEGLGEVAPGAGSASPCGPARVPDIHQQRLE